MIESIYKSKTILREIDRSPFGSVIRSLAKEYLHEGYKPQNIQHSFAVIMTFVRWAAHKGLSPKTLRARHIAAFFLSIEYPGKKPSPLGARSCCRKLFGIIEREFGQRLVEKKVLHYQRNPDVARSVAEFEKHMRDVRGLNPTSIVRFSTTVGQFLTYVFPVGKVRFNKLGVKDITGFLCARGKQFQPKTVRTDGAAIKSYMRFLHGRSRTKVDLSYAVPVISIWRNQSLIHTISKEEMLKLLFSCNLDEAIGVRDYAILLLLMRYGLRPIEVVRLRVNDIIWTEKKIVIRGKGSKESILPLESDVASSIRRYLDSARPFSNDRHIFLTSKAPTRSLKKSSAISAVVKQAIIRAGLKPEIFGARLLRYSVASAILNRGGNLMEVAELLRHSSFNTTARYTRLDFERLKLVPLPWPK